MLTKNLTRAGIAATITAALIALPMAANATEETVWQAWIMPNDGTDWPQAVASDEALAALPCGTTWRIQNDEYLPHERDRFVADGVLEYGEDFGSEYQRGAISWYFTEYTTSACAATVVTPVYPTVVQASGVCVGEVWTVTPATVTLPGSEFGRWLDHDPGTLTLDPGEYTFGFTTAEGDYVLGEGGDYQENGVAYFTVTIAGLNPEECTVPAPTATETTEPTPQALTTPEAQDEAVQAGLVLAETGPEEDTTIRLIVVAALLVIAGTALTIGRRKQEKR